MKNIQKKLALIIIVIGIALIAIGCASEPVEVTVPVEVTREVEVTRIVTEQVEVVLTPEPGVEVPYEDLWASSGHAKASAEAFRHWDEDDPKVVPTSCAKCHTPDGYRDFLGADGSEFGVVDNDATPAEMGITCEACHNEVTLTLDSVVMPSGVEITGLGDESRCMQCHQGRESTVSVNAAIEEVGVGDDESSEDLGFKNIHYYAAAATKYGTIAQGGYQYDGKSYDANFAHVDGYTTCIGCHNPHTLEVKVAECQACHTNVETVEDLKDVRMPGSLVDYDGDGDMSEGVFYEIQGLREILYAAIQSYAAGVAGVPVVYDAHSYPYFFIDDGNGVVDEGEAAFPNRYAAWTPRLLRAAYNYQVSTKDPGAFAHGGKYIIELLYDSIEDLNPEQVAGLRRIDHGHFAGSEEAFRHWDEDGAVSGSCSRCHSSQGLPLFLTEGVTISQPPSNGMQCSTCHDNIGEFTRYQTSSVTFPSGATIDLEEGDPSGLCMTCHQGRSSTVSVNDALTGLEADTVDGNIRFINIHYFAAGATRYGSEVQGAYQYEGKEYAGFFEHVQAANQCIQCHNAHQLDVQVDLCVKCHQDVDSKEALQTIRMSEVDFDGDGDVDEGIYGEVATLREILYTTMQEYVAGVDGAAPIVYAAHSYPYFFIDDGNGVADPGEANYGNRYNTWTPRLLRAAYNYQYAAKDPGGFAHNGHYLIQILIDSIEDLGGDVSAMTRP